METWKPIRNYEELYAVSDYGNVKRTAKHRSSKDAPLRTPLAHGYPLATLSKGNRKQSFLVHRLICDAFIGIPPGHVVNHRNGIKTDNRLTNLEVVTRKENEDHKWDVLKTGARACAKLTISQVGEIRSLRNDGLTLAVIASRYGVAISTIHAAVSGITWKRNMPYTLNPPAAP